MTIFGYLEEELKEVATFKDLKVNLSYDYSLKDASVARDWMMKK